MSSLLPSLVSTQYLRTRAHTTGSTPSMSSSAAVLRSEFSFVLPSPTVCVLWFTALAVSPVFFFARATPGVAFGFSWPVSEPAPADFFRPLSAARLLPLVSLQVLCWPIPSGASGPVSAL